MRISGFNLNPIKFDFRTPVFQGFSNTLVLKDLYNRLRAKGSKFTVYDAVRRDVTKFFLKHLKQVINRDLNCIGEVIGKGGEGKSLFVLKIAKILKEHQIEFNKYPESPIIFTHDIGKSKMAIKNNENGSIIIQDEFNELEGDSSNTVKIEFNNLIRSMRFTQICYLMSNVDFIYIKGLHFVLEMWGFDDSYFKEKKEEDKEMQSIALLRYVDDNKPRERIYLGMVILSLKDIVKDYNESLIHKKDNWERLEFTGGARSARLSEEQRIKYAKILLKKAKEKKWSGKINMLENYFDDTNISCNSKDRQKIINEAIRIRKEKMKSGEIKFIKSLRYDDPCARFFQKYYMENLKKEDIQVSLRVIQYSHFVPRIASLWISGISQDQIADNLKISSHYIKRIIDTFMIGTGIPKKIRFGHVYEKFWENAIDKCIVGGDKSEPDLYFQDDKGKIIGCGEVKIFNQQRNQITIYLDNPNHNKSLRPSVKWCEEHGVRYFPLFLRMNKWRYRREVQNYLIPIDIFGEGTISLQRSNLTANYKYKNDFKIQEFFLLQNVENAINHEK